MSSIDTSKTDKELSSSVEYAIQWFESNGFTGTLTVNNTAKTEFVVSKDGTSDTFRLTATQQDPRKCDIAAYMEQFGKSFSMKQEIERLRGEINARNQSNR